jgi:Phospholipase_D-nuclease N-terminal
MLLLCVVFALVTAGFVMPCLLDIARTPRHEFSLAAKRTWLLVVVAFWAFGALAWLLVGRRDVRAGRVWSSSGWHANGRQRAFRRHPAGRDPGFQLASAVLGRRTAGPPLTRYIAPDDNPEFLDELDRRIREWREDD